MTNPRTKKPQGNPQGKGAVPVLDALHALQAWQPDVKSADQILREFCLSTLVLSARFDFRVVPGNTYYLRWCCQRGLISGSCRAIPIICITVLAVGSCR